MVTEDDFTLNGGHTMQYKDHASQKCTLETYYNFINKCHPNNLIKNNSYHLKSAVFQKRKHRIIH